MGWKRFSHLSTSPDLGNAELLIIGKQTQRVGNIPLKAKAGLLTLCPRSSTRPYLLFSFTRIPNVLNVPEVTEQSKMGPLYEVCHGRRRGGRSLKCFEGLAEWGYLQPSLGNSYLPRSTPPLTAVFAPFPNSSACFKPQLNNTFLSKLIPSLWLD